MLTRLFLTLLILLTFLSCAKKETKYEPTNIINPYVSYKEGLDAFERNDFFFANKKFTEAEQNFEIIEFAAKSSIMSSFSLYGINFYDEAVENLERYLKTYPSDKNVIYANYLLAIIYFEQISDEKKDLKPLIKANEKIDYFIAKYPESDYSIDLKFKKDLIQNQLAAKEMHIAKYYISTQKWVPAINRLKIIVEKFNKTVFIEEALHRLVEIHYHLGLKKEAENYASILGYNFNSSEWFKQSYKVLNKDYNFLEKEKSKKIKQTEEKGILKKIIKMINKK